MNKNAKRGSTLKLFYKGKVRILFYLSISEAILDYAECRAHFRRVVMESRPLE